MRFSLAAASVTVPSVLGLLFASAVHGQTNGANTTDFGKIDCDSYPYQIANPIFYKSTSYNSHKYLGVQTQGNPIALTTKYAVYSQFPTPVSFWRCRSKYMPADINNVTVQRFYGQLRLSNYKHGSTCFGLKTLRNAGADQAVFSMPCNKTDGPTQLRYWVQLDQYDDNMQVSFVGRPREEYDDGTYGSYKNVNLTTSVPYWPGQTADFWGIRWENKTNSEDQPYTVQLEYNSP